MAHFLTRHQHRSGVKKFVSIRLKVRIKWSQEKSSKHK